VSATGAERLCHRRNVLTRLKICDRRFHAGFLPQPNSMIELRAPLCGQSTHSSQALHLLTIIRDQQLQLLQLSIQRGDTGAMRIEINLLPGEQEATLPGLHLEQ
jgi:hypothetical protein